MRLSPRIPLSRRTFLGSLGTAALSSGVLAYSRWIEPEWLELTHTRIPFFPTTPARPLRILLLSDFHYSRTVPLDLIARALDIGQGENPDLALLAGDFVTGHLYDPVPYEKLLRDFSARVPCLACLGNHDGNIHTSNLHRPAYQEPVRAFLARCGIPILQNCAEKRQHENQSWEIIGLGDLWSRDCDAPTAFPPQDRGWPRLVLCHNPDSKQLLTNYRWNLMTCGHSHGGQMRLPLLGAPLAPLEDKRYADGLNPWKGRLIYTTRGVGNLYGIRILCRPEVSILDLY